ARMRRGVLMALFGVVTLVAPSSARTDTDMRPTAHLHAGGAVLDVFIDPGRAALSQAEVLRWISTAAQAVSHYYGRYPVSHARIRVLRRPGEGVLSRTTYEREGGALVRVVRGDAAARAQLARDGHMTRQVVHRAL